MKDPLGKAILSYVQHPSKRKNIIVHSTMMEDDIIPVYYLFREYLDFPLIEKRAVDLANGRILDVGAAAGAHTKYLMQQGKQVEAIDISEGAVTYLLSEGISARKIDFFDLNDGGYDTILLLMNGIGIAGSLEELKKLLSKVYELLNDGGSLIADSTDVKYLYQEDDGSYWLDMNSEYYGNFDFQMEFEGEIGEWFKWLYVDFETLEKSAEEVGFKVELIVKEENSFLVKLIK